ncbi:MAG TPA: TonB-dependent receptor [Chitinophagales bacterium]|nr:TonB-dependent receptor [Chitinophagales bacterium]
MKKVAALLLLLAILIHASAQNVSQTIKGRVTDKQSQSPLIGATVKLINTSIGAVTDDDGYFKIENVSVGRVTIEVSYLGYKPATLNNVYLSSGKELVLEIELEENVIEAQEVIVNASKDKITTNNEMATVSTRTFSIEESQRYAGARNDVARMASNFAGVQSNNDALNDIVIRGNSPVELLWRLEGVDIPNPNHFGDFGSTGGPVSMLNNNVLANSDFFSGAFPADYGNAVSGVFDLKMRNGNDEHYEFLGQFGFNGFELGAEGPFSPIRKNSPEKESSRTKKNHSSFLINYRYSTLGIFTALGINFGTGTAIPYYQDLNFKLNFPGDKLGRITVFGLAGKSHIDFLAEDAEDSENFYTNSLTNLRDRNGIGVIGASHTFLFSSNTYGKFTVAFTHQQKQDDVDSVEAVTYIPHDVYNANFNNNRIFLSYFINKKFSTKNTIRAGIYSSRLHFNIADSFYRASENKFVTLSNYNGNTMLWQPYLSWQFRPSDKLKFTTGVHALFLGLNKTYSIEPRFGVKWQFNPKQSLSFGYGLNGIMQPVYAYFKTTELDDHSVIETNNDLGFTKSHQVVLGYDVVFSSTLRLKIETYYQHLFGVPVERNASEFSMLNNGSYSGAIPDSLYNGGSGRNYGAEVTFEKFLDHGFYFLFTTSLFESKYRGSDDVLRNTAFNSNFIFNLLAGKDFELNRGKQGAKNLKVLAFDGRVTYAGGRRYTPIDLQQSILHGEAEYDHTQVYGLKFPPYLKADARISFRLNSKKITQEWSFYVENFTNHHNALEQRFDSVSKQVTTIYQLGFFPVGQYRIEF